MQDGLSPVCAGVPVNIVVRMGGRVGNADGAWQKECSGRGIFCCLLSPFLSLLEQWDTQGCCGMQGQGDKVAMLQCSWWAVTRLG